MSSYKNRSVFDSESEDDEYEEESEEEEEEKEYIKPVFVPKSQRTTIIEQEIKYTEEELRAKKKAEEEELKKSKSRELVAEYVRKSNDINEMDVQDGDSDAGMPLENENNWDDDLEVCYLNIYFLFYINF